MATATATVQLVPTRRPHGYCTLKPALRMRLEHVELVRPPSLQTATTVFVMAATEALRSAASSMENQLYDAILAVCRQRFDALPEESVLDGVLSTVRERKGRLVWALPFSERYTTLTELSLEDRYTLDVECRGVWVSSISDIRLDVKLLQVSVDEPSLSLEDLKLRAQETLRTAVQPLRDADATLQEWLKSVQSLEEDIVGAVDASALEGCRVRLDTLIASWRGWTPSM